MGNTMKMRNTFLLSAMGLSILGGSAHAGDYASSYAVVVSKTTAEDAGWKMVVDKLVERHHATIITYDKSVKESADELKKQMPRYTAFVGRAGELGVQYVADVHRLTRRLDDDPYTDTQWGIVTGPTADDALRIASDAEPLVIKNAVGTTGINLALYENAAFLSDGKKGEFVSHVEGKDEKLQEEDGDRTTRFRDTMDKVQPNIVISSGHATQKNLEMPFSTGNLVCKNNQFYTLPLKSREAKAFETKSKKVYFAVGNCLAGNIDRPDCMALTWLGAGNTNQMVGYTVVTWFGKGGWGTLELLNDVPGMYDVADCFFFNHQSLIYTLETRFPKIAREDFDIADPIKIEPTLEKIAQAAGKMPRKDSQDAVGYSFDRDVVAFYGDPAWEARLDASRVSAPISTKLSHDGNTWKFEVTALADTEAHRAVAHWLPQRVQSPTLKEGQDLKPILTDNFVYIPATPAMKKGQTLSVVFTADAVAPEGQ